MSNEDAKFFAGEMEDFLDIPAMLCEAIEKRLTYTGQVQGSMRFYCSPSQGTCKENWGVI